MTTVAKLLPYVQVLLAVLLVACILMQRSDAGAGGVFGGADNWNAGYHTRRGFEKFIFNATIVIAVLFAAASLAALLVK
ncbi:MAG: preprotein translocase subunit SecG [Patescibacteria group bacterium]|nr:preprotein translocase subunit SecG [Patescibacteria group bacterium]MDE1946164.1 preprotein translocase subunit SecG [Patescibacteria group bacterium]